MKELEARLVDKQIKPTAMRIVVLDFLLNQVNAQSLTDMELKMHRTDRVTIYRTIRTFEENGLVHRIEDGSGITKFALCEAGCSTGDHNDLHLHFYCLKCEETHCLPKTVIPEVKLPDGYETMEIQLIVKGVCNACRS